MLGTQLLIGNNGIGTLEHRNFADAADAGAPDSDRACFRAEMGDRLIEVGCFGGGVRMRSGR
jgi:hypothetical protein